MKNLIIIHSVESILTTVFLNDITGKFFEIDENTLLKLPGPLNLDYYA
jgi:hypothetical protein